MIRTQVYLPDELFHQAKARATATNSTISQLIRDGLQLSLANPLRVNAQSSGYMDEEVSTTVSHDGT